MAREYLHQDREGHKISHFNFHIGQLDGGLFFFAMLWCHISQVRLTRFVALDIFQNVGSQHPPGTGESPHGHQPNHQWVWILISTKGQELVCMNIGYK